MKEKKELPCILQEVTAGDEEEGLKMETAQSRAQKWRSSVFSSLDISGDSLDQAYHGEGKKHGGVARSQVVTV